MILQRRAPSQRAEYKTLLILLNPVAPHITEELWQIIGGSGYVYETDLAGVRGSEDRRKYR